MQLPALLVSDPHFTSNPADEYRWSLWPWLRQECESGRVKTLNILGDLTDAKDYHPAELTNRLVSQLKACAAVVDQVNVLMGNHDYLKGGHAYFEFLSEFPRIKFITKPCEDAISGPAAMFLPHTKTPSKDWAGMDFSHYQYLFLHQTISGAIASNGEKMEGELLPDLNAMKVYSGDIHVPQIIGPVEYVGSPYHVHFGDSFKPRCVLLDRAGKPIDLHFETISRRSLKVTSLRELRECNLQAGDQVKVTIQLSEADKHRWHEIRRNAVQWLRAQEIDLHGISLEMKKQRRRLIGTQQEDKRRSPADLVLSFVEGEELGGDALDVGLEILE